MRYLIWGAGNLGKQLLLDEGSNKISYFIDNNPEKQGEIISGVEVIDLKTYLKSKTDDDMILIPYGGYALSVAAQLKALNISKKNFRYKMCHKKDTNAFISDPYKYADGISYEYQKSEINRKLSNIYAKQLYEDNGLFDSVEIETYNRCNGLCSFCPVNAREDTRPEKKMAISLFEKIVSELADLHYSGAVSLHSNNEPFLDERIIQLSKYLRDKLPDAYLHLYTNGTLLTLDKFIEIIDYLDEMIIDNYNDNLKLNKRSQEIYNYCEKNRPELKSKLTIALRKQHEVLTNRGGDSPNKQNSEFLYENDSCILPFKQLIIRPSGEVSLCCNDPLGKFTMGDLNKNSILDVWYGEKYKKMREKIISGRKNIGKCSVCDVFY